MLDLENHSFVGSGEPFFCWLWRTILLSFLPSLQTTVKMCEPLYQRTTDRGLRCSLIKIKPSSQFAQYSDTPDFAQYSDTYYFAQYSDTSHFSQHSETSHFAQHSENSHFAQHSENSHFLNIRTALTSLNIRTILTLLNIRTPLTLFGHVSLLSIFGHLLYFIRTRLTSLNIRTPLTLFGHVSLLSIFGHFSLRSSCRPSCTQHDRATAHANIQGEVRELILSRLLETMHFCMIFHYFGDFYGVPSLYRVMYHKKIYNIIFYSLEKELMNCKSFCKTFH